MGALLRAGITAATVCLAISSANARPPCAPMDFDGDCKSDILWRNSATGKDYLWWMNGLTIVSQGSLNTVDDQAWQVQGIGDFDGDGKADILWRNALTGENYLWLMNGLTIAAQGLVNVVDDPAWQVQGVGDFDGDGRADILWRNPATGENYIYLMNGWTIAARGLVNVVDDPSFLAKAARAVAGDGRKLRVLHERLGDHFPGLTRPAGRSVLDAEVRDDPGGLDRPGHCRSLDSSKPDRLGCVFVTHLPQLERCNRQRRRDQIRRLSRWRSNRLYIRDKLCQHGTLGGNDVQLHGRRIRCRGQCLGAVRSFVRDDAAACRHHCAHDANRP